MVVLQFSTIFTQAFMVCNEGLNRTKKLRYGFLVPTGFYWFLEVSNLFLRTVPFCSRGQALIKWKERGKKPRFAKSLLWPDISVQVVFQPLITVKFTLRCSMSLRMMRKGVVKGMLDMVFLYHGTFLQFLARHLWSAMSHFSVHF